MIYTCMRPGNRGRYKTDYMMIRQRHQNQILIYKIYPGADTDLDHNLVMMKYKFKKLNKNIVTVQGDGIHKKVKDTPVQSYKLNGLLKQV